MNDAENTFINSYVRELELADLHLDYDVDPELVKAAREQAAKREYTNGEFTIWNMYDERRGNPNSEIREYLHEYVLPHYVAGMIRQLADYDVSEDQLPILSNLILLAREFDAQDHHIQDCMQDPRIWSAQSYDEMHKIVFDTVMKTEDRIIEAINIQSLYDEYQRQQWAFSDFREHIISKLPEFPSFVGAALRLIEQRYEGAGENLSPDMMQMIGSLFVRYTQTEKKIDEFLSSELSPFYQDNDVVADLRNIRRERLNTSTTEGTNTTRSSDTTQDTDTPQDSPTISYSQKSSKLRINSQENEFDPTWEAMRRNAFEQFIQDQKAHLEKQAQAELQTQTESESAVDKPATDSPEARKTNTSIFSWSSGLRSSLSAKLSRVKSIQHYRQMRRDRSPEASTSYTSVPPPPVFFTEAQLEFIEKHWRPLMPMGETAKALMEARIKPEYRFLYEAHLCAKNSNASAYRINKPALQDKYDGVVVLGKCNIDGTVLVLESENIGNSSDPTVTRFETGRKHVGASQDAPKEFEEGTTFKVGDCYSNPFTTKYIHELHTDGAFYFPTGPQELRTRWLVEQTKPSSGGKTMAIANAEFDMWRKEKAQNPSLQNATARSKQIEKDMKRLATAQRQKQATKMYEKFKLETKATMLFGASPDVETDIDKLISKFVKKIVKQNQAHKAALVETIIDAAVLNPHLKAEWKTKNVEQRKGEPSSTLANELVKTWDMQQVAPNELRDMIVQKLPLRQAFENGVMAALKDYGVDEKDSPINLEKQFLDYIKTPSYTNNNLHAFLSKVEDDIRAHVITQFNKTKDREKNIPVSLFLSIGEAYQRGQGQTFASFLELVSNKVPERDAFFQHCRAEVDQKDHTQNESAYKKRFIEYAQQHRPMGQFLNPALGEQTVQENANIKLANVKGRTFKRRS